MTDTLNWSHMGLAQVFALAAALGFASGIRLYALLFLIGLTGHFNWIKLPEGMMLLAHPAVVIIAGVLMLVEFLADKIPAVDTVWDHIHTFVRLPAAAVLAGSLGGDSGLMTTILAVVGGGVAATSHLAKTSTRMAINTSPEPVSNWGASLGEDAISAGLLWMIFTHPLIAGVVAVVLLVLCIWLIHRLWRFVRNLFRRARVA